MTLPTNDMPKKEAGTVRRTGFILSGLRNVTKLAAMAALSTALIAPVTGHAQTVDKQTEVVNDGAKSRVNLSNRLRMLNQEISAAACQSNADIDLVNAHANLYEANTQFNQIIKALRESDITIGVPTKEKKPRILAKIWEIEQEWVKVKFAANKVLAKDRVAEFSDVISSRTNTLAKSLDDLVDEVIAQYSNPAEMLTGDALRINVAARQRKLAMEMAKNICAISSNQANFGNKEDLEQAFALFDRSLGALREGLPAAGIAPPPNDWVTGKLTEIWIKWLHARHNSLETAADANDLPRKKEQFTNLRSEMNNAVSLYMTSTLGQDQAYREPLEAYGQEILATWIQDEDLLNAVRAQNETNASLSQTEIFELDRRWLNEVFSKGERPLIDEMLKRPLSDWLFQNKVKSSGLITEVFVMDKYGMNVGVSAVTSDLWQGDEDKFKETFLAKSDAPHIGDVVFDQSTGSIQSQISMPIRDPKTEEFIGAITFGINVQAFL